MSNKRKDDKESPNHNQGKGVEQQPYIPSVEGAVKMHESEIGHLKKKHAQLNQAAVEVGMLQVAISQKKAEMEILTTAMEKSVSNYNEIQKGVKEWMKEFIDPKYGPGEINLATGEILPDSARKNSAAQPVQPDNPSGGEGK
jgi:hypothetical protein